jgi:hypothetical protein
MSEGPIDPVVVGRSRNSFAQAAQDAVNKWESQRGGAPDETVTLRVIDMYVTAEPEGPAESGGHIGDYIVVVRPGG